MSYIFNEYFFGIFTSPSRPSWCLAFLKRSKKTSVTRILLFFVGLSILSDWLLESFLCINWKFSFFFFLGGLEF